MRGNNDLCSILHKVQERSARKKCEKEVRERSARKKCEKRRIIIFKPGKLFVHGAFAVVVKAEVKQ
jgi:hypothetical protein